MAGLIRSHFDADVHKKAFDIAMDILAASRSFPKEEMYSLTDHIRRSSRSVCANFAEAWRKRIYEAAFVSKINDAEAEAAETQTWIAFAVKCDYLAVEMGRDLFERCEEVIRMLVSMRCNADQWVPRPNKPNANDNG